MQSLYLLPLLVSFSISSIILVFLIIFNKRKKDIRKSERHIHKGGISRLGGIALIFSFIVSLLIDEKLFISTPLWGVIIGCFAILILGIADDFLELHWKTQLFFQFVLVAFVTIMGVRIQFISNPFGGIFLFNTALSNVIGFMLCVFWVVFLMNAINFSDGIDGESSGIAMVATAAIFILSLRPDVNQPPVGIITAALLGSLAAFLFFNFYPAKIIAGTSGSMFMGFILAILSIFAGAKIATTLLVLVVPILDAIWVIGERIFEKKSIFMADRKHLHYRLMELGWSQKQICFFYYSVTIFVAYVALNTKAYGKALSFSFIAIILFLILFLIQKKVQYKKQTSI